MYITGIRDQGTVSKGDILQFTLHLFIESNGSLATYYFPAGATIKVAIPGENNSVVSTNTVITNQGGMATCIFTKEQTLEMKVGQPILVAVVEAEGYCATFEMKAPFVVRARSTLV